MEIIATGKEAVLQRLEQDAAERAGQSGAYLLAKDDEGRLVLVIAGTYFSPMTGIVDLGTGARLKVINGLTVGIIPP